MQIPQASYESIKEKSVQGRYLTLEAIAPLLKKLPGNFKLETIGQSVNGLPLYQVTTGNGSQKVLMWSQMHGNESTTTKAVLDLFNFLQVPSRQASAILESCTIRILPMLNPDGAQAYTRENAGGVDLNRDAQARSQPESRALRMAYEQFEPDYCFNLHDQRTIFNVGDTPQPATISFLAPAHDAARSVSDSRAASMKLIAAINKSLQLAIPGQVGRYDDSFNLNCVGDTFQALMTPTVLFEAGHYPGDYQREHTRLFIFQALMKALAIIAEQSVDGYNLEDYHAIPENQKRYVDILVNNAGQFHPQWEDGIRIGIQYKELLRNGAIHFVPQFHKAGLLPDTFGHQTFDAGREADRAQLRDDKQLAALLN